MSAWKVFNLALGRRHFVLSSAGMKFHGEVWQGGMRGELFWGLKALQYGAHAQAKILRAWKVTTPPRLSSLANTGATRRFVRLERPASGAVVLRFQETVTAELVSALRAAFQPAKSRTTAKQGEERHEEPEDRIGSDAEERQGRGEGGLLGQGDAEGQLRSVRQDPPRRRQQGRKVTRKPAKKPTRRKP